MASLDAPRASPPKRPSIDVLAFPPDETELQRRLAREAEPWERLEQRGRVVLFFAIGMFLAWAAAIGAVFEFVGVEESTWFGVASITLAVIVIAAYFGARWILNLASHGRAGVRQRYADVTQGEAKPLLQLAREDSVVGQYLRCVGRQRRALREIERRALYAWAGFGPSEDKKR